MSASWSTGEGGERFGWDRVFTLTEVEALDAEALRACDGYEYHYCHGGRITWHSLASGEELEVTVLSGLPRDNWRHWERCDCPACRRASDRRTLESGPPAPPLS